MAASTRFPFFDTRFETADGALAANYYLSQYVSGTTTDQNTFTDAAGLIPNVHPLQLDSEGRCTLFGTPGQLYTFVLRATAGGTALRTWNEVAPVPIASATAFMPVAGGTFTGAVTLSANASASLQPVTLQQMNAATLALTTSLTTAVAAATAAAAAATAAAAAVTATSYSLASATGGAVNRTVTLSAGTWQVVLDTSSFFSDSGTFTKNISQDATVSTTTVSTAFQIIRTGGAGYGRVVHGRRIAVGTLTVASAGSYTMAMVAAVLDGTTSGGSILTIEKTA